MDVGVGEARAGVAPRVLQGRAQRGHGRRRGGRGRRRQQRLGRARLAPHGRRPTRRLADVRRLLDPGVRAQGPGRRRQLGVHVRQPRGRAPEGCARRRHRGRQAVQRAHRQPPQQRAVLLEGGAGQGGCRAARGGLHHDRVPRRPGQGRPVRPLPRRQGRVRLGGAVREHPAVHRRHRRVAPHRVRPLRLVRRPGAHRAHAVRHRAHPRRSGERRAHLGPGDEEARGWRVRVRVLQRLGLRRARRERRHRPDDRLGAVPRHRRAATWP